MDLFNWFMDYIYEWRKFNYYVETMTAKYLSYKLLGGIWWNDIDDKIILGGIPLHNLNHLDELKKEHVGAILSLLEDFEMRPALYYFRPITKDDWEINDIRFLQIRTEDSCGVSLDDIRKCMKYISDNLGDQRKVYIHCKAGRGRSASIVLCYLLYLLYGKTGHITPMDVKKSYEYLKTLRAEVSINEMQLLTIYEYALTLQSEQN
jgi:protein-tyrosine phosphatase